MESTTTDTENNSNNKELASQLLNPSIEDTTVSPPAQPEKEETRPIKGWKWVLAVLSILASTFLFALDTTVVADVQANIVAEFGNIDKLPWLGSGFVLPAAALTLPWSKAYSLFNIKWLYIAHVVLFEVGSAIAGASPNMNALIVGRIIAGIGGCGMYIGGMAFFGVTTTSKERPMYISLITPVWGLGTVLGPIIGGAFADSNATWRWGFYINLVIFAVFAPVFVLILPSINLAPGLSTKDKLKQFDWLGLVVFCGWVVAFVMAISFGGSVYPWKSASEIVLWVMTGVLLIAFILTQKFHPFAEKKNRLYPAHTLTNWKLDILQFSTFASAGGVYISIYYIPLIFQFSLGESALDSAVRLLPFVFMIVFFSLANGFLLTRLGYFMPWYLFGSALALVGAVLMYTVNLDTSTSTIYGYSVLLGIGGGSYFMCSFGVAHAVVAPTEVFDAIGIISVGQGMGIVFFISVAGIIFQNLGVQYITPLVPQELVPDVRSLLAGTSSALFQELNEQQRAAVLAAIMKALDLTFVPAIAASALSLIVAPFLWSGKVE